MTPDRFWFKAASYVPVFQIYFASTMDSSKSVSSRESLYSVESTASEEEEDEHGADIEVFLSDSGSDAEKEARPLRSRRGAYPAGQSFLYSPQLERTNSGLLCRDHKRQTRKPLNLLTSGRLRPPGHCCRYPVALGDAYCTHLMDTGGSLSRKAVSQKSSGQKRLSDTVEGSQSPEYTTQPSLHGIKRQRNQEVEAKDDPCSLGWTEGDQLFAQKVGWLAVTPREVGDLGEPSCQLTKEAECC